MGKLTKGPLAGLLTPPKPEVPEVPEIDDPAIEEEKRRQLAARARQQGRSSTILTGGQGVQGPILGSAARITGGIL